MKIYKAQSNILVNGILSEPAWEDAEVATDFHQNFPGELSNAITKTEARLTYDDQNIYVGISCYDDLEGKCIVESLKRRNAGSGIVRIAISVRACLFKLYHSLLIFLFLPESIAFYYYYES